MPQGTDKLKTDIGEVKQKIAKTRESLTGNVVEKKAKEAGKSVSEFGHDLYVDLDSTLENLSTKVSSGAYRSKEKAEHGVEEVSEELKRVHKIVKENRREITGGHIEDRTVEVLHSVEKRMDGIIKKIKD